MYKQHYFMWVCSQYQCHFCDRGNHKPHYLMRGRGMRVPDHEVANVVKR